MSLSEFDLIQRYFASGLYARGDVPLGVGDDCALLAVPAGYQLAVTMDTLVAGVHFLPQVDPRTLGHKCLAVNLSDLAAMGAEPAWATLALTLPETDEAWLAAFCEGWSALARQHRVQLIGGDTTRGPLSVTVQAHGLVPAGQALRRSGARAGERIYVSGELGDAGLGLRVRQGKIELPEAYRTPTIAKLELPQPRIALGLGLRGIASSAIDISDGLLADLGHILEASGVGAAIDVEQLPLSEALRSVASSQNIYDLALSAGDDYELCFTVPEDQVPALEQRAAGFGCPLSAIGHIEAAPGLRLYHQGQDYRPAHRGYQHFANCGEAEL